MSSAIKKRIQISFIFVSCIILSVFPKIFGYYYTYVIDYLMLLIISVMAYNILLGFTGLLSLGHGAFYGIAGYVYAISMMKYGIQSFEVLLALSLLVTLGVAVIFGYFFTKASEIYFAFLTLSFAWVVYNIIFKFHYLTGGSDGILTKVPQFLLLDTQSLRLPLFVQNILHYIILFVFFIYVFFIYRLENSPFGKSLLSIRENQERAKFIGINVERYKLYAFILSAFGIGLAGVLAVPLSGVITPESISYWHSLELALMGILGGCLSYVHKYARLLGSFFGAITYYILKLLIHSYTAIYWRIILGLFIIIVAIFLPGGLLTIKQVKLRFKMKVR